MSDADLLASASNPANKALVQAVGVPAALPRAGSQPVASGQPEEAAATGASGAATSASCPAAETNAVNTEATTGAACSAAEKLLPGKAAILRCLAQSEMMGHFDDSDTSDDEFPDEHRGGAKRTINFYLQREW